jgi:methylated-DNA-[protein]-cysteine S-methyltransferase
MNDVKGRLHVIEIDHPLGRSIVAATGQGVRLVILDAARAGEISELARGEGLEVTEGGQGPAFRAARQLREYFEGRRRSFNVALDLRGTDFQVQVWRTLRQVGFGRVVTYGELARRMGRSGASRAVGNACGANPVPVIVPCHRVLATGRRLGGFSAGLDVKRRLLDLEGVEYERA